MHPGARRNRQGDEKTLKPRASPKWWYYLEVHCGRRRADLSIRVNGAHGEAVLAGHEGAIVDGARLDWRAPSVSPKAILIAHNVTRGVIQSHELKLDMFLPGPHFDLA